MIPSHICNSWHTGPTKNSLKLLFNQARIQTGLKFLISPILPQYTQRRFGLHTNFCGFWLLNSKCFGYGIYTSQSMAVRCICHQTVLVMVYTLHNYWLWGVYVTKMFWLWHIHLSINGCIHVSSMHFPWVIFKLCWVTHCISARSTNEGN